jgi:hypothetical protein
MKRDHSVLPALCVHCTWENPYVSEVVRWWSCIQTRCFNESRMSSDNAGNACCKNNKYWLSLIRAGTCGPMRRSPTLPAQMEFCCRCRLALTSWRFCVVHVCVLCMLMTPLRQKLASSRTVFAIRKNGSSAHLFRSLDKFLLSARTASL